MDLYLASASPRRRELLAQLGVTFERITAPVDETPLLDEDPHGYVLRLARAKAQAGWLAVLAQERDPRPVLAADTTVVLDGGILGKPDDAGHAHAMLKRLSGSTHVVLTALAVAEQDRVETVLSESRVTFAVLTDAQIAAYVASGEPLDKAGAYGIQGRAGLFVTRLDGSYTGVMGLPLYETAALLARYGLGALA
ncbi:Maf family nucleotide pyrophosphatase [Chitiniphilus purpureus]|uniref:dTTP/UTP pyrophosphatase n=1 Tax=Chitiniphilus purpureus TaxID=2981137 RepID=A0ABY6DMU4_9NEIS|nr:Maf family protein [Chitiniphilus sp. CD1]UXY15685.1 Maf family nucleotide pyrophosphatase [Chitiniphilus sp. CD1]